VRANWLVQTERCAVLWVSAVHDVPREYYGRHFAIVIILIRIIIHLIQHCVCVCVCVCV
jgi:hypothetical protein